MDFLWERYAITGNTVTGGVGEMVDLDRVSNATFPITKIRWTAASPYAMELGFQYCHPAMSRYPKTAL